MESLHSEVAPIEYTFFDSGFSTKENYRIFKISEKREKVKSEYAYLGTDVTSEW